MLSFDLPGDWLLNSPRFDTSRLASSSFFSHSSSRSLAPLRLELESFCLHVVMATSNAPLAVESASPSGLDTCSSANENGCGADDAGARGAAPSPAPSASTASSEEGSSATRTYAPARCNEAAIQQLLQRTGYSISSERGQRRYAQPDFVPQGSLKCVFDLCLPSARPHFPQQIVL